MAIHRVLEASGIKWQITVANLYLYTIIFLLIVAQFIDGNGLCHHTSQKRTLTNEAKYVSNLLIFCAHMIVHRTQYKRMWFMGGLLRADLRWHSRSSHIRKLGDIFCLICLNQFLTGVVRDWPNHSSWAEIRGMNDGTAKSNPLWSAWESLLSFDARCLVRVHDERPWCQYVMVTMCSGPVDHLGTDGII